MTGTADSVLKCITLGLVLVTVSVQVDGYVVIPNHPNCPDSEGPIPVYFVHPTNCSKFYECHGKNAHEFDCPPGLHFNSRLNVCDHPLAAQCESQGPGTTGVPPTISTPQTTSTEVPTDPTQAPTPTPTTTVAPTTPTAAPTTTTAAPTTPTAAPTTTTAAPTTTAAATTTTTAAPTTTTSTSAPQPTTTTPLPTTTYPTTTSPQWESTTTQRPVDPNCPPAGASWPNYWAHPTDCTRYQACWEGCEQQFKCPDGLYFNADLKACVQSNWHCACPVIPPAPNAISSTAIY